MNARFAETPTSGSGARATLLSAALAPRVPGERHAEIQPELLSQCRQALARTLERFGARELDLGGDQLVVLFHDPTDALRCGLAMQEAIEAAMTDVAPAAQCVVKLGIHQADAGEHPDWAEANGLEVVSTLRQLSAGEVFISGEVHALLVRKRRFQFTELGEKRVSEEAGTVRIFSASDSSGGSAALIGSLASGLQIARGRMAHVVVGGGFLAALGSLVVMGPAEIQRSFERMLSPAPMESIALLHFTGDDSDISAERLRGQLREDLLEAFSRRRDFSVFAPEPLPHEPSPTPRAIGSRLDVDAMLSGSTSTAGNWVLVQGRLLEVPDGEEIWSGTYYRRVGEFDAISLALIRDVSRALGLDPAGDPSGPGLAGSAHEIGGRRRPGSTDVDFERARAELEDALQSARTLDLEDETRITSLNSLASLYYDTGRDAEAIPLYREVLTTRESSLGPNHPEVAVALNNLASVLVSLERYEEAEIHYERSLRIREETLGPEHPRVANALSNLGLLRHRQGRLIEAEALHERALAIREKQLQLELGPKASDLMDRAARLELSGNLAGAEQDLERASEAEGRRSGIRHFRTARVKRNLARVRSLEGDHDGALSLLDEVVAIFTGGLGPDHVQVARSLSEMGEAHRRSGNLRAAERYHEGALAAFERSLGINHPEVAGSLGYLILIFEEQGREQEAEAARRRRDRIRETLIGPVFDYVAARSTEQAVVRKRVQDDLGRPQPLHEYQLEIASGELVSEKRRLAESLHNIALLYVDLGRLIPAEDYNLRALGLRRSINEGPHPEVGMSLHSLGNVNALQGRLPEAHTRLKEALQVFEQTLGQIHPHVARCWGDLATLLSRSERETEASYAAERAARTRAALDERPGPPASVE